MTESEEEPKSLLIKLKEESQKVSLKLNIKKIKIMASSPIISWQISSVTESCPTLCDHMDCSTPGFPVHQELPELAETHVRRLGVAVI